MIISHGITCRLFLARFLHWPVDFFQRTVNLENGQILILEKQLDGRYRLLTPLKEDNLQTRDEWDSITSAECMIRELQPTFRHSFMS